MSDDFIKGVVLAWMAPVLILLLGIKILLDGYTQFRRDRRIDKGDE